MRYLIASTTLLLLAVLAASGCGSSPGTTDGDATRYQPITTDSVEFWDRQTTTTADLLNEIIGEFNASHDGPPIDAVQSGNYGDIYRKSIASIKAGKLPGLATGFENMTSEYARSGAVAALDPWIANPETGLTTEELDDFFPAMLATNTFAEHDGKMLSFPYTKSVLVMYYNKRVFRAAGIDGPPVTWDAFLDQCRQIKKRTGKHALSIDVDCSTVSGMIFSMGGDILRDGVSLYDSPEAVKVFTLLETLIKEDLAFQNPPRTFNDETAFSNDEIAFLLRTSAQYSYLDTLMEGHGNWGIAPIPQADPNQPGTVLFGGNFTVFNTTPEQQRTAWAFIKFFTTPEISARWSLGTGYLPVRKSAAQLPNMKAFWEKWSDNRVAFDCLAFARPEPNVAGWQEIRALVEKAQTEVITGMKTGERAARDLKKKADDILVPSRLGK